METQEPKESKKSSSTPLIMAIIIVCGIFVGTYLIVNGEDLDFMNKNSEVEMSVEEKVTVTASFTESKCTAELPVAISIKNNSSQTIDATAMDLKIYREGHSFHINEGGLIITDKIIKSGEEYRFCNKVYFKENFKDYALKTEQLRGELEIVSLTINEEGGD